MNVKLIPRFHAPGPLACPWRGPSDGPAVIAVALGSLFRCLSCRGGLPDGRGRLKTSWVARAFRVGERQFVAARNQLVELGWLIVEGDNRQWAMNRWGRAYRINLHWNPPDQPIAHSAPPPPIPAAPSAPLSLDRNPLREEEIQNQNPASGGPAGVQLSEGEAGTEISKPPGAARRMIGLSPPAPVVPPSPAPGPVADPGHDAHGPRHGFAGGFRARETGGDLQAVLGGPGPGFGPKPRSG